MQRVSSAQGSFAKHVDEGAIGKTGGGSSPRQTC